MLGQDALARIRLPVGEMTKVEVRERAAALGLRTADKPDSQDICFVGDGDYRDFLREHFPDAARPGVVVDKEGGIVGAHEGTVDFTIGQRRGLGIALGEPRYVVDIEPATATVVIGRKQDLLVSGCVVKDTSLVAPDRDLPARVQVKVRYRARPVSARVARELDGWWQVLFDRPQHSVAPGQAAVLYDGDEVLGGGTIVAAIP
jgi:tRNA-specific 2-thiouridylase